MASFPPLCFPCTLFSLHPSKEDCSSPSLPSSRPLTRTSTAFLCPPKLNSILMIRCFLPLPCLGAAPASQARSTGRRVGMAHGAGEGRPGSATAHSSKQVPIIPPGHSHALLLVAQMSTRMQAKSQELWLRYTYRSNQRGTSSAVFKLNLWYEDFCFFIFKTT